MRVLPSHEEILRLRAAREGCVFYQAMNKQGCVFYLRMQGGKASCG
ncbi:MAG: hypothetical protein ACPGWR_16495 [Ardenticatenaceae bacterium]